VNAFTLITFAYGTTFRGDFGGCFDIAPLNLISGGPDWIRTERWTVQATIPASVGLTQEQLQAQLESGDYPELRKMLLSLLEDRFNLALRRETREIPAYALTANKTSPRVIVPSGGTPEGVPKTPANVKWWDEQPAGFLAGEPGGIAGKEVSIPELIPLIAREAGRPVIDRTGLTGKYSLWLVFRPTVNFLTGRPMDSPRFAGLPILNKALEEAGLPLEEIRIPREVWVIERVDRPTEN
jgi:uncharacterized protein (TIGR03435 family)